MALQRGNVCGSQSLYEFSMHKVDENMEALWTSTFGTDNLTTTRAVVETENLGIMFTGDTKTSPNKRDVLLTKVDSSGILEWARAFDSGAFDVPFALTRAPNGVYAFVGGSSNNQANSFGVFLITVDSVGNVMMNKRYGMSNFIIGMHVHVEANGDYVIAGGIEVNNTTTAPFLLKVNSEGNVLSFKVYRGPADMTVDAIIRTGDGGILMNGIIDMNGNPDVFAVKLDIEGNVEWCKMYSKPGTDIVSAVAQTPDGGYMHLGSDNNGFPHGDEDIVLIRTSDDGRLSWAKQYGGAEEQRGFSLTIDSAGWALFDGRSQPLTGTMMSRIDPFGNGACEHEVATLKDSSLTLEVFGRTAFVSEPFQSYDPELSVEYCPFGLTTLICEFTPSDLSATTTGVDVSCYGIQDGMASASVFNGVPPITSKEFRLNGMASASVFNGVPPYSYEWNTNPVQTTPEVTGLSAGQYTCVVTDSTGAQVVQTVYVEEPDAIALSIQSTETQNLCIGDSAVLNVEYNAGWNYEWFRNGLSFDITDTSGISVFSSGNYSAIITDTLGNCPSITDTVGVQFFDPEVEIITYPNQNLLETSVAAASYQWFLNGEPIAGATEVFLEPTASGNYHVVITDNNGCEATSMLLEYTLQVGVDEQDASSRLKVFPNPATDELTVTSDDQHPINQINLVDMVGRIIINVNAQSSSISVDVSELPPGIYFVLVHVADEAVGVRKVLIE